jgi:hypothetical protein
VLLPTVQGTTIGYLMCFLSIALVLVYGGNERTRYLRLLLMAFLMWVALLAVTQLADATVEYPLSLSWLPLVNPVETQFVMRGSLFTQSLYVVAVMLYAAYVYVFHRESWDRLIVAAGVLLAVYGMYEWVYYLILHQPGDFISNRSFGQDLDKAAANEIGVYSGSDFQTTSLAGLDVMRVKSLTGEPSMYALSMFPFWIYAKAAVKSPWPARIIGTSLIMTLSTSAMLGYVCYLAIQLLRVRINVIKLIIGGVVLVALAVLLQNYILDFWTDMVVNKVNGSNVSGAERSGMFNASLNFWMAAPVLNKLFGIGFGYIRSTDMFSTILVNNGILGVLLFSLLMLYPVFKLDWTPKAIALRQCVLAMYVMMMISVPEFSYLAPWTFVALAYSRLYWLKRRAHESNAAAVQRAAQRGQMRETRDSNSILALGRNDV